MSTETNLQMPESEKKQKPTSTRYRFSVPEKDVCVHKWIANQSNPSQSIREIIKERIKKTGFDDVTCYEVKQQGPVGRPKMAVSEGEPVTQPVQEASAPISGKTVVPQPVVQQPVQPVRPVSNSDSQAMLESLMS